MAVYYAYGMPVGIVNIKYLISCPKCNNEGKVVLTHLRFSTALSTIRVVFPRILPPLAHILPSARFSIRRK